VEPHWKAELRDELTRRFGEPFATRAMQHLAFVANYTNYGAPGHMDMVLINLLAELLDKKEGTEHEQR
jgi:hypothetical protein